VFDQAIQDREAVGPYHELVVLGAEVIGDAPRVLQFVELRLVESDGEGLDRVARQAGHDRHHDAGIEPARQEGPERNVADHVRSTASRGRS
jgi:hypothetical protein